MNQHDRHAIGNHRHTRRRGSPARRAGWLRYGCRLAAAALLFLMAGSGFAAGQVGVLGRAAPASPVAILPTVVDAELVHLGSQVTVEVDGDTRVARFEIQEEFRNLGGRLLEADYLYPIPRGAVFTNLSLFMGETELRGEMLPADQARGIYEEIVRRKKDPALVELIGSGLVRTRVFPIEAGQTRKIILRYTQVLPREGDLVRLRYPRTRGVMLPTDEPPQPLVETTIRRGHDARPGLVVRVRVTDAGRFGAPVSPSHTIDWSRPRADELEVSAVGGDGAGDFELLLPLSSARIGASLLVHSPDPGREEGYFLMLVTPPPFTGETRIARDVTLVLDVSGSMSGHKMEQARAALRQVLRGLTEGDRFRLFTFASVIRTPHDEWTAATPAAVDRAVTWLEAQAADGSTNIHDALVRALEPVSEPERLSLVVFLTDGLPTVSETDPERIAAQVERLRDGERVFAFGVGEDVNTYLLDRMVEGGRGTVSYVAPGEDVEAAMGALATKIATPALADLRIDEAPVDLEELYPGALPDLFHGDELVILGRYRGGRAGRLVLTGQRTGTPVRLEFDLDFAADQPDNEFIARLWASRKAGALTAHLRLHGADPETIEQIRELGLRYGILTEYTSYLVEEPGMSRNEMLDEMREQAAAPMPQSGRQAFRRARADADLQSAGSLGEAEVAMSAVAPLATPAESDDALPAWQRVGRRIFTRAGDLWRDARAEIGVEATLRIEPQSAAWFELLERLPGLRSAAALGDRVIIAGEGLVLEFETGGRDRLTASEWRRLESAFAAER